MIRRLIILLLIVGLFSQEEGSSTIRFNPETGEIIDSDSLEIHNPYQIIFDPYTGEQIIIDTLNVQDIQSSTNGSLNPQEKFHLYEYKHKYNNAKINPFLNTLYNLIIPTSGHYRIKKWKRGATIFCSLFLVAKLQKRSESHTMDLVMPPLLLDTFLQTIAYNKNQYKTIFGKDPPPFSLNLEPTYQGANLTMSYVFN